MNSSNLPPELHDLEKALLSRNQFARHDDTRARIMARVKKELARAREQSSAGTWHFAAAVAASILVCLNLMMSAVNNTDWNTRTAAARQNRRAVMQQLHEVLPELSELEIRRYALFVTGSSIQIDVDEP
jgi:hypothetical protein